METAGNGSPSARRNASGKLFLFAFCLPLVGGSCLAQEMYKYRDENGEWIYTDRAPVTQQEVEVRELPRGETDPRVLVYDRQSGGNFNFIAQNEFHAPVEVILGLDSLENLTYPNPDQELRWVVPPRSRVLLMQLQMREEGVSGRAEYRYVWLPGDPGSEHKPDEAYRVPFAISNEFRISQAFPVGITHLTPDSYYAVDIVMPVGTDIYAARSGTVFEIAGNNFRGGVDPARNLAEANLIRILHNDGTFSVYAHLNWNTIRVEPGDTVVRGEYIADSGNTGYTTGPHLHFAVMQNKGLRVESIPIEFEGPNNSAVVPETGNDLAAY